MASLNSTISGVSNVSFGAPRALMIQVGTRALSVGRDCRRRFYRTAPVLDCRPGLDKGHLEMLLFRRWLVVLSKAH